MNEQPVVSPTKEEARATLAEIDRVVAQTRTAIAQGPSAPILILWGCIWLVADVTTQFNSQALEWLWWVLDLIGVAGTWWFVARRNVRVKRPGEWRYGVFWGVIFFYAVLWVNLLVPVRHWPQNAREWTEFEPIYRRMTAYFHTIPMFAYVIGGLFTGRFFIWLGVLVTALTLIGYCCVQQYFYLWLGITGGGSLIFSGVFIRKFWR
jgi:hypothetical protein